MKPFFHTIFLFLFTCSVAVHAQWNSPLRFRRPIFGPNDIAAETNLQYSQLTDLNGNYISLGLDVFYPKPTADFMVQRPLIVMVHGGGFAQGSKDINNVGAANVSYTVLAKELAQTGYVVASVNYRLYNDTNTYKSGYAKGMLNQYKTDKNGNTSEGSALAWYAALQDVNAAIKFLTYNAARFRIEPQYVFLFGESAGAITAATLAVTQQAEIDAYYDFSSQPSIGSINNGTLPQYRNQSYRIRGVAPVAGAIVNNSFFNVQDQIPFFLEHSINDCIVSPRNSSSFNSGIGSISIMQKIRGWASSGQSYPCSNLYLTYDGTYDIGGAISPGVYCYHTLSANRYGWTVYKDFMADYFHSLIWNNGVCQRDNFALYHCQLYSSVPPFSVMREEALEREPDKELTAYPVPASQTVTITGLQENTVTDVTIYDAQGSLIKTATLQTAGDEYEKTLSIEELLPGIYSVQLKGDSQQHRQVRIAKQ